MTSAWRRPLPGAPGTAIAIALLGVLMASSVGRPSGDQYESSSSGDATASPSSLAAAPDDGLPIVVDADDAVVLVRSYLGAGASAEAGVRGPISVTGAGRHWLVAVEHTREQLLVSLLTGSVLEAYWLDVLVAPDPLLPRLSAEQAKQLALEAVAVEPGTIAGEGNISSVGFPPHQTWCAKLLPPSGSGTMACVDLNTAEVFSEAEFLRRAEMSQSARDSAARAVTTLDASIAARRLVAALEDGEQIEIVLTQPPADRTALDALVAAADVRLVPVPDGWALRGRWEAVFEIAGALPPQLIQIHEDRSALRAIATRRLKTIPEPAAPYAAWPRSGTSEVAGEVWPPADIEGETLDVIARGLLTLDGRAHDHLTAIWNCEGAWCHITVRGELLGSGSDRMDYSLGPDGLLPWEPGGSFESVPRPVLREAERIARLDQRAVAAITDYEVIAGAAWQAEQPQLITLRYERPAQAGLRAAPGRAFAATARNTDWLLVTVDLQRGHVTAVVEDLGADHPI